MKQIALFIALFVGLSTATAQLSSAQSPTTLYSIELGEFESNVKQTDFDAIRGYAYLHKRDGKIYAGSFTSAESAEPVLAKLKAKGYSDAYLKAWSMKKSETVYVIQLASKSAGENINWRTYAKVGDLFTMPNAAQVRIVHGYYDDINDARVKLKEIQNMGFADAFVKAVKEVQINAVTDFDTGDKKMLIVTESESILDPEPEVKVKTTMLKPIYRSKGVVNTIKTKRKSVIKLQEGLKEMGLYGASVDGMMGKTTSTAYDKSLKLNRRLKTYQELAEKYEGFGGWEEVRLLMTMTRELSPKEDPAPIISDLLDNLPEENLTEKQKVSALNWHNNLWKKLETWSTTSQYNDQVYTALKVAYYRSLVHLEDYFAEQGIKGEAGTALSVATLQTLIASDFENFN
ncbi:MAG: hypothetical protein HC817_16030 [Saprospiraceae bacterium]|nr:hypothetical protein [Saprospiraceae bacterium]